MDEYTFKLTKGEASHLIQILGVVAAKDIGTLFITLNNQAREQEEAFNNKKSK